jgi:hypothetical protein
MNIPIGSFNMGNRAAFTFRLALLGAALTVTACDRSRTDAQLAGLDNQILANEADPAVTSALGDEILVDPALAQQSNRLAVRTPRGPVQAQVPSGGEAARAIAATGAGNGCGAEFDYGAGWAKRLPAAFPVLPGARITEAAGNDAGNCTMRVVTFTSNAAPQRVLNWYRGRAEAAGFSAESQVRGADQILAGTNEATDGAFYLIVTPLKSGGSDISLIANNGR